MLIILEQKTLSRSIHAYLRIYETNMNRMLKNKVHGQFLITKLLVYDISMYVQKPTK